MIASFKETSVELRDDRYGYACGARFYMVCPIIFGRGNDEEGQMVYNINDDRSGLKVVVTSKFHIQKYYKLLRIINCDLDPKII